MDLRKQNSTRAPEDLSHAELRDWGSRDLDGLVAYCQNLRQRLAAATEKPSLEISEAKPTPLALQESEDAFRQIFDEAPDPILLIDDSYCFVDCNRAAVRMLGATTKEQVLMRHPSFFSPQMQPDGQLSSEKADSIIQAVFGRQSLHFEWLHCRFDGTEFSVEVSLNLITRNGRAMQLVHWRDTTQRREAELTLRKLSTAVEQSPTAILITDSAGAIEYANPKFYALTGYAPEEVLGRNPRFMKAGTMPAEHYRVLWETISAGLEWQGELHNRTKQGTLFWEKACISPIKNASGAITHFIGVKEDITERRLLLEQMAAMAHYDNLTGLPNRTLFFDRARQMLSLAKREKRFCGVMFIDLDGFKDINDSHGHEAGDQVLRVVAERIKSSLRASDTAARMGGDEFTVILDNLTESGHAGHVAEMILGRLSQPVAIGSTQLRVGASIGIGIFPDDAEDVETLVSVADKAMYQVKRSGKNRYGYYSR